MQIELSGEQIQEIAAAVAALINGKGGEGRRRVIEPSIMTLKEVADYLRLHPQTVRKLLRSDGAFPAPVFSGRPFKWNAGDIAAYKERNFRQNKAAFLK